MSSPGAYEDEMGRFLRLSDEELARLLAGEAAVGDEAYEEVASLLAEARSVFSAAPDTVTRARHIAAISETSHALAENGTPVLGPVNQAQSPAGTQRSGFETWRRVVGLTKSLLIKAGAATLAASMSMVGMAYAGVDLPGTAAEEALESVLNVELPNQSSEAELEEDVIADAATSDGPADAASDVAKRLYEYISNTEDTGCVFGQTVASIASGSDPTAGDPCAEGTDEEAAGKDTGDEASAEGRATAEEASTEGRATGEEAAQEGRSKAPVKEADETDADDDSGEENPSGEGRATGEEAAEEGQSNNPTGKP